MTITVTPIPLGFVSAFLVQGRRAVLVDAGGAGSGARILAALQRLGVAPRRLALVLVTHGHADHFGGLPELLPHLRCPVAVHSADAGALRDGRNGPVRPVGAALGVLLRLLPRAGTRGVPPVQPGLLVEGELDLAPWGIAGRVMPTPGHTPGSVSVILDSGDAIVGDLLRGGIASRGSPRWPFVADDLGEVRRSVARVLDQRPRVIWTAHGGPVAPDAAREFLRRSS